MRIVVLFCLALLRIYQLTLSPLLAVLTRSGCRFYPSCSEYAALALKKHGLKQGLLLSARRLGRCHPLHQGGVDFP